MRRYGMAVDVAGSVCCVIYANPSWRVRLTGECRKEASPMTAVSTRRGEPYGEPSEVWEPTLYLRWVVGHTWA